ncbi:MAG: peptide chain release factor 1 [Planctomycetes bacterium]|nr:peptide chain release factor 1 [Planctomycetota bacterium]
MSMKIKDIQKRYEELGRLIVDPAVMKGDPAYPRYLKEHGALAGTMRLYERYCSVVSEMKDTSALLEDADPDMRRLAQADTERLEPLRNRLRGELLLELSVDDSDLGRDVIMEIRPGAGGEEAALFVADLYRMYLRFAASHDWKTTRMSLSPTDMGGYKEVILSFSGSGVFPRLRFEGGTHRVQRVPVTESQGRIHTSTATVAILLEADEVDIEIRPEDLEVTAMHSGGPGGQSVNTASSAVRIVHKPTGLMVHCEVERSQYQNKMTAMKLLRSRLMEQERRRIRNEQDSARRSQIGTGDRSEKIRTYNFPQLRVTDHRLSGDHKNFELERVLGGDLDTVIERLTENEALGLLEDDDDR